MQDKITLALVDLAKIKNELRGIKKDMRAQEKIDTEQYVDLKKAYKDLRLQLKSMEEECEESLKKDDFYNSLRELKMKKEEEFASVSKSLFDAVSKLPAKPIVLKMEVEDGFLNVQIQPEMKVYVNGKEEKKRFL